MKFDKISFGNIHESEYNPRKIHRDDLSSLTKNLNEFGLVDPIIINLKNNKIIGGHQRYKVLQKKYKKEKNNNPDMHLIRLGDIGWVFEDDNLKIESDEHEKALNLALNKISGEWDYDKLTPLMSELSNSNFNMDLTGFDSFEIESFNIAPEIRQEFNEVEEIEEKGILVQENGEKVMPFSSISSTSFNIAPEIRQEFNEVEEIEEKGILVQENGEKVMPQTTPIENGSDSVNDNDSDEELVSSDDIEKITKYTCPKCGYKW